MPESTPAVFLSYASQDAEAATRMAASLRSAGIEVWFDVEGGLEQGDEWDAKIRNQIKDCVLFIAVISANTQARHEGYFRLEWELAAQRAMSIASGVPFILPVVIDDTNEQTALVPDRFKAVQWTKLPDGEVSGKVQARFLKLWSHRTGAVSSPSPSSSSASPKNEAPIHATSTNGPNRSGRPWLIPALIGVVALIALAFWQPWQSSPDSTTHQQESAPLSEVQQLIKRAQLQLQKPEHSRATLAAANELCEQAAELDPNDATVWATWSQVHAWFIFHRWDNSPERKSAAHDTTARAMQLTPASYESRLAQAIHWVRSFRKLTSPAKLPQGAAEQMLLELLAESPDEPRALLTLAVLYFHQNENARALDTLKRLEQNPTYAAEATKEAAYQLYFAQNPTEAEKQIDRSIGYNPYWDNLFLKVRLALSWHGDLDLAKETLDSIPVSQLQEDRSVLLFAQVYTWRREPQPIISFFNNLPREWISAGAIQAPKAYLLGKARLMANQPAAARQDFNRALALIDDHLVQEPNSLFPLVTKALVLQFLGRTDEAQQVYQLVRELDDTPTTELLIAFNDVEAALERIESQKSSGIQLFAAADLRLNPIYDPIREDPRFQALLAEAESDPRYTPNPIIAKEEAPDKSIAVLPLANMSPDAENAFFADGVHEDIIGSLTKVRALTVLSRTSTLRFRDATDSSANIGEALGVRYLVQGSVRRAGNRVLVSVQLIDSTSDQTVWTEKYNRTLEDIFAVQAEISTAVADQLEAVLSPEEVALIEYQPTDNPEAYDAFLQFRGVEGNERNQLAQKVAYLEQAVTLDPNYSQAWAQLAIECVFQWDSRQQRNNPELLAKAHHAVIEARRTGPDQPYAPNAQSVVAYREHRDIEAAVRYSLEAVAIDPTYAYASDRLGQWYFWLGQWSEAEHYTKLTLRNSPGDFSSVSYLLLRRIYQKQGRWNEEETLFEASRKSSRDYRVRDLITSRNDFLQTGDRSRYLATLQNVTDPSVVYQVAEVFLSRDFDRSLEILTQLEDGHFNRWYLSLELSSADLMEALIRFEQGNQVEQSVATTKAKTHLRNVLEVDPQAGPWHAATLAICFALEGDRELMEQAIVQTRAISETAFWQFRYQASAEVMIAMAYLIAGEEEHAIDLLVAANQLPGPNIIHREIDLFFIFDRLRGNPRFDALVEGESR